VLVWYYTNLLFTPVDWSLMLSSLGIYSLWILFIISVTTLAGTLLKASSGIAGISIALLGVLSVSSGLFSRFMEWSPTNLRAHASGVLLNGELLDNSLLVIFTTVGLSLIFVLFATYKFKRFEQF
jgi:ABC-2 type transport system permease protein